MEMASGCPRPAPIRQASTQELPRKPVRGPHGGWQESEINALRARIAQAEQSGESLRCVFDDMSVLLGRKPNSIRNFYYAQLRDAQEGDHPRPLPFETFTQSEIEQLIRSVLTARAQGMSVRACVRRLSGGDKSRMLRYQNKYRSVVRTRPEFVQKIMADLRSEGVSYVSPYRRPPARIWPSLRPGQRKPATRKSYSCFPRLIICSPSPAKSSSRRQKRMHSPLPPRIPPPCAERTGSRRSWTSRALPLTTSASASESCAAKQRAWSPSSRNSSLCPSPCAKAAVRASASRQRSG